MAVANPFTIRIYVPEGDPEGLRIIDRQSSPSRFFVFPRTKWDAIRDRPELQTAGVYILTGYADPDDELPTVYVGQADRVAVRIRQHVRRKEFWDRGIVFVSETINATHARWLEYALVRRLLRADRSKAENTNNPKEPTISEAEKAEMQVFFMEILQTLPLAGLRAFEVPRSVAPRPVKMVAGARDTVVVPAQKEGFDRVFLGQHQWHAIRIGGAMLESIKYIAAYQTQPVSAVTHWAPVESIEPYGEEGKYRLVFAEPARNLERPIPFGDAPIGLMQGPRYTNSERLKTATKLSELFG